MGRAEQAQGDDFEKRIAKRLGSSPQKRSGGLWFARMDVPDADRTVLWSLKSAVRRRGESFQLTPQIWDEVYGAARGHGGLRMDPGVIVEFPQADLAVLNLEDLLGYFESQGGVTLAPPTKAKSAIRRRQTTSLMREEDEE